MYNILTYKKIIKDKYYEKNHNYYIADDGINRKEKIDKNIKK